MRFFFDVADTETTQDQEGAEHPSLDAAIAEAARGATSMSEELTAGGKLTVRIRDERAVVAIVRVSIEIERL